MLVPAATSKRDSSEIGQARSTPHCAVGAGGLINSCTSQS
jgi:hypothetical protein